MDLILQKVFTVHIKAGVGTVSLGKMNVQAIPNSFKMQQPMFMPLLNQFSL